MNTNTAYSPWDQLPAPEPSTICYPVDYFYENTAKHLVKDTVRIMNNGLHIDLNKVVELEAVLEEQIQTVELNLANNSLIEQYLKKRHSTLLHNYVEERKSKLKPIEYFLKPFNASDPVHRSYFMHVFAETQGIPSPTELLPTGVPKWSAKAVKTLSTTYPLLERLVTKEITDSHPIAKRAMRLLAEHKQSIYNRRYEEQIANPDLELPKFNPSSPDQKRELFDMLGIESDAITKTGQAKWDRDQIERIHKETLDPEVRDLTQQLIDHSYAAIVRNNFIKAFYRYTIDDRLYGQYKLLGAKTGRFTSSNPNMLNAPSTGSIFAKPIKKCFTAPEGFVIAAIDYSALEDRVVANLSRDNNKLGTFLEGLDGHSLSATYYYPDRVKQIIGDFTDNKQAAKALQAIVEDENHPLHKVAKSVRQDSKPISFGLAYGAFPAKVAATVKIPLTEAEGIFNAYHNELYPGITEFRENYVLPTASTYGQLHLGLGFTIKSDDPDRDIRTLNNACSQFWSILTALTINKIHHLIDEAELQDDIKVTSTIYDSIYFEVRNEPEIIQWLNDRIIPIMEQDFMTNQIVKNSVDLEIGPSWAELHKLSHNASIEEIETVLSTIKESTNEL